MERTSIFERQYDLDAGTAAITLANTTDPIGVVDFSAMHPDAVKRFALAGAANYAINAATQAAKRKENALPFAQGVAEALQRIKDGNIAIGSATAQDMSATGLLGAALVSLGKKSITFADEMWEFTDNASAKAAARNLYDSKKEQVVKRADGSTIVYTGRQFFAALVKQPAIDAYIKDAKSRKSVELDDFLGG